MNEALAVFGFLSVASLAGLALKICAKDPVYRDTIKNLNARIRSWWIMCGIFFIAMLSGPKWSIVLFACISFFALRELITLMPTRVADHRSLLWVFFILMPLQYILLGLNWYGLFSIMIPVYAFLLIPARSVIAGDCERFLERVAKIQWSLMLAVYCVSYAPALLTLNIHGYDGRNAELLFYFIFVVQISDVLQYVFGKFFGKRKIAPLVSPNKTWEGFFGGCASAILIGAALYPITPFNFWQAALMSSAAVLAGFAGGLTMSAIKRDRGVKDFGTLIEGHGGMMDRIDSICFAAPLFFHLTRYFFV